jgi:hypothetical protein
MGTEWLFVAAGGAILIALVASLLILQKRSPNKTEALSGEKMQDLIPAELERILKKAPLLKGNGRFAYTTRGCIPYAKNFDAVRMSKRIYFVEPTLIDVLLVPDPSNIERKLAVAVTLDAKVLGYVPTQEAGEMYKYLLANPSGIRARAKIYLGSRPEYNGVMLDMAKPLRLESRRR